MFRVRVFLLASFPCLATLAASAPPVCAQQLRTGESVDRAQRPLNVAAPTMGGTQFWSDRLIFRQWRIQENLVLGHFRLLDGDDIRRAWGTFENCHSQLERFREERKLEPIAGEVVLVLHGLGRTRDSMASLCSYLEREGRYVVLNMSYATTRGSIEDHAASVRSVMQHLDPGVTRINFVAHSLGNLVIRRYLHERERQSSSDATHPPLGRIVMLGPPNQGSQLARRFPRNPLARWIAGESAVQLAAGSNSLSDQLATPRCEFGIIAGGQRDGNGGNPLLHGDNDYVVSVQETKLTGARDFVVLPVYHGVMMSNPTVQQYALRFLRFGYFQSEAARQPITGSVDTDNDG